MENNFSTNDYVIRTIKAYNASPQKYETSTSRMISRPEMTILADLLPDKGTVLDAGCAYGRDMQVLKDEFGLDCVGIDMSVELLRRGAELHPDYDFRNMDVRHLDYPDNSFSGIWCAAVLLHLNDNDIRSALAEFNRVLKPGGAIFVSLKEGIGSEYLVEKFSSNGSRFYNYKTLKATEQLLIEAGFNINRSYVLNERERFGADKRDLDWVYALAKKVSTI